MNIYRGNLCDNAKKKSFGNSGKSRTRLNPRIVDAIMTIFMVLVLIALSTISVTSCAKPGGALDQFIGAKGAEK